MAVVKSLKKFLEERRVKFEAKRHREVYTAQEIAAATHTPGNSMAKVVVAKAKEGFFLAVLPASFRVDFKKLKTAVGSKGSIGIATEKEFKGLFADCEVGAMPPFGSLYSLPVVADKSLTEDEVIAFNAGSHTDIIRMRFSDYKNIENPRIAPFA